VGGLTAITLERVQKNARSYPGYLLPRGGTALGLFAAGYHGWNDCVHFLRANMTADCVDLNQPLLDEMADIYPDDWEFHCQDAWKFGRQAMRQGRQWDVVSVDTFLGEATRRSMSSLDLWTSLATEMVTATAPLGSETKAPPGWQAFAFPRSPRAEWVVLTRG
jgi:hypothetical protein